MIIRKWNSNYINMKKYAGISLLSPIYEGKMLGFFENFDKNQILKILIIQIQEFLCLD